jgi:hypothetical protein
MKTKKETKLNRYSQIIEKIFLEKYKDEMTELTFLREDIVRIAKKIGVKLPKNLGDVIYSFRYRAQLPESIRTKALRDVSGLFVLQVGPNMSLSPHPQLRFNRLSPLSRPRYRMRPPE